MKKTGRRSHISPKKEAIKKEISEINNKIKFPDYKPIPKKKSEMSNKERQMLNALKLKENSRIRDKNTKFSGWEYKDRFSYRKS